MEAREGLLIAGAFVLGIGVGAAGGYLLTKKSCDVHTQEAIEEMKAAHKQELKDAKKEAKNEPTEAGEESVREAEDDGVVKIDKPSITEISSIINNGADSTAQRTKYNLSDVKKAIKKIEKENVKEKKKHMVAKDYSGYMDLDIDVVEGNELTLYLQTPDASDPTGGHMDFTIYSIPPATAGTPVDIAVERTAAVRTDILVGLIQTSGAVGLLPSHHFPKTGFGMMMKKRK